MSSLTEFLLARITEDEESLRDMPMYSSWWEPERYWAECEARRRIIAALGDFDDGHVWASAESSRAEAALLALAQPYADHPDLDPSWRTP